VPDKQIETVWLPIIARSLSRLSLQSSAVAEGTSAEKARFLESLGLPRKEVAEMLGTTPASITELMRQAKKKKKKK
jgi:CRP-like cAMP-binding protein